MCAVYKDQVIYHQATSIIKDLYGENAFFREGQDEAIEAVMTQKRTLLVQRTGWGKSLVYFVCTKLMRERHRGVTMVVSPLLVLMQNQIEAAKKMGLTCDVLNSTVKDRREDILHELEADKLDLILVTPETLFAEDVQSRLRNIRIGLFVIDEAHCISDWGHDFRLDYGNLRRIVRQLPESVPILATTATANDRVIDDLQSQLGDSVYVSRGPLTRDSLYIQVLNMPGKIERYAWIAENVPKLNGSGIIYCLTQRDCDYLAEFLKKNRISAAAYYARKGEDGESLNCEIEEKFRTNKLKVIVATIKLGMGYDKGDIAFVIHYQMPSNIVSYYQQIGRAGRSIDKAYIFLMYGKEDEEILNYFINTAFPSEQETEYSELAKKLSGRGRSPKDLFEFSDRDFEQILDMTSDEADRIKRLLDRNASLSFELSRYRNMGIETITRADAEYPRKLKKKLGNSCPPIFYYAGDLCLLDQNYFGYVGARTVCTEDIEFTKNAVRKTTALGHGVVSGGAKGIDTVSGTEALLNGSFVIEYLSDSLMKKIKRSEVLKNIQSGKLLMLSVSKPDAGFHVGFAMMRNRYIYAQAEATVVVRSELNKGGTWTGANENLKNNWCPTLCWDHPYPGNRALLEKGAFAIPTDWDGSIPEKPQEAEEFKQTSIFDLD